MRRCLVLALCPLLILLGGCGKKAPPPLTSPLAQHTGGFDSIANIAYGDLRAAATISQEIPDACTVAFLSPESIQGLEFVFRQDAVDVAYKGLAFQFDPQAMPGSALANMAVSAINRAMRGEDVALERTDAGLELRGALESGDFSLTLDPDQGNLLKLSIPDQELEIEFVNFRFLD